MDVKKIWITVNALLLTTTVYSADLTVTVRGLEATGGLLSVSLFDTKTSWDDDGQMADGQQVEVDEATEIVLFKDLAPGTYAVRLMHDENGNGKLDTNLFGVPKEGWGFSNNPNKRRPATWDQAAFTIRNEDTAITIDVR